MHAKYTKNLKVNNINSRERFSAAAKGEIPDIVPTVYYTLGASKYILENANLSWQDVFWNAEKISNVMRKAHELIPHDNVCSFLSPACGLDALGLKIEFSNVEGAYINYKTTTLNSWDDLENLEVPDPKKDGSMPSRIKAAELLNAKLGNELAVLGGFGGISTWAMDLRGIKSFVIDAKRNPEFQKSYMEFLTQCAIDFCVAQVEAGCDWIISAEDAFATEVLDPERAWKINGIHTKKLANAIHKAGAGYILHCCGNAKLALERMVETGADVLSLDNVELSETKEKIGSKVALMGNIKLKTLVYGKPDDVERECEIAIKKASENGGYMLSSGYIYPAITPLTNILALIKSAGDYGRY